MALGDRSWSDRSENYADGYLLAVAGTTATAINSSGNSPYLARPVVVYSLTVSVNPSVGSGDVSLVDGTASADAGDTRRFRVIIASGVGTQVAEHFEFPRGIVFDAGLIVSATTVTGAISLTYKNRYS